LVCPSIPGLFSLRSCCCCCCVHLRVAFLVGYGFSEGSLNPQMDVFKVAKIFAKLMSLVCVSSVFLFSCLLTSFPVAMLAGL
jgi:hypothetical protein